MRAAGLGIGLAEPWGGGGRAGAAGEARGARGRAAPAAAYRRTGCGRGDNGADGWGEWVFILWCGGQ